MHRSWLVLASGLGISIASAAAMLTPTRDPQSVRRTSPVPVARPQSDVTTVRLWRAPPGLAQYPIWPHEAPDGRGAAGKAERVLVAQTPAALRGRTSEAVFDVSVPTMTVFPPRGRNTGAAIVVFPGGGFKAVVITAEGTEICDWIAARGITCILSKYRVPDSGHHWDPACKCGVTPDRPRALQDAQRTIRLVRARAGALRIDPHRIGVMGFSAGGYLVAQTSNMVAAAYQPVDAIDKVSSRPDFAVALYPGHLCRPGATLDPGIHVTARTPPTFLLQAWDDPVDEICNSTLYARALDAAGVPAEVHLFAKGGHAFALRNKEHAVVIWPSLVQRWLKENGIL